MFLPEISSSTSLDSPTEMAWSDFLSNFNIDREVSDILSNVYFDPEVFSSLEQYSCNFIDVITHPMQQQQLPSSPSPNFSDSVERPGNANSLSTPACLSLLRELITDISDLESESLELQMLGEEPQLVCLKLCLIKEVLLDLAQCPSGKLQLLLQRAAALKTTPDCMIENPMTQSLRYLIESTAQYALSQMSIPEKNQYQCALTTSWQPLQSNRCTIATLMYMFSLDGGRDEGPGLPGHVFQLKLPFWTPNVKFYYHEEFLFPPLNHAARGTLGLQVFESSRQTCVGVIELKMTSQKISYAPEHVQTTKSFTTEKIDLRLDCVEIQQTARYPPQPQASQNGKKVPQESIVGGAAAAGGNGVFSAGQSHNAVAFSEIKDTSESLKGKYRKKEELVSLEILQQHFDQTLEDAASSLKVSRSTLKRICRKHGISVWPSHRRNKLKPLGESVQSERAYNPALAMSPSLLPTVVEPHQPTTLGSKIAELQVRKSKSPCYRMPVGFGQVETLDHLPSGLVPIHNEFNVQTGFLPEFGKGKGKGKGMGINRSQTGSGSSKESTDEPPNATEDFYSCSPTSTTQCAKVAAVSSELVSQPTRPNPSAAHFNHNAIPSTGPQATPNATAGQGVSTSTVKVTYGEDMIRFRFPSTLGISELKKEVTKRLPALKVVPFKIKYKDDKHDLILLACDVDLQECADVSTSLGNNEVRLFVDVDDKITNSRSPCESRRGVKRKHSHIYSNELPHYCRARKLAYR